MNTPEHDCQEENAVMEDEAGVLGWSAEEWERSTRKGEAEADELRELNARRGWTQPAALRVGEVVRLEPGEGHWMTVDRVTPCAAYLRSSVTREVQVTDRASGEARTFLARSSELVPVSCRAFVERRVS